MSNAGHSTSPTLLGRLRQYPADQAAWAEFVDRYGPRIYHWCRRWNLQNEDAEDVTQEVLAKLADEMQTFDYDASRCFRAWLKTVARRTHLDFVKCRRGFRPQNGNGHALKPLESVLARVDFVAELAEEFDLELAEEAKARVRLRVHAHTWEAFHLTQIDELPGAEVAARLNMTRAAVFEAAYKVRKKLGEEIRRLEGAWINGQDAEP